MHFSTERLSQAQHAAKAGFWHWDILSDEISWTDELFSLFGLDPAVVSASFDIWRSVVHPEDLKTAEDRIAASVREHIPLFNRYRILLPTGESRWIEAHGSTKFDECGQALRMTGICIDVTERLATDEELKVRDTQYRLLSEQSPDGIFVSDADGRYLDVNPTGAAMLGYSRSEILAMRIPEIHVPDEAHLLPEAISRYKDGAVVTTEWRFRRKDGSTFIGQEVGRQLPDGRLQGILRNITERKQAEFRLACELDAMSRLQSLATLSVEQGDLKPILSNVLETAIAITAADFGSTQLLDPASGKLRIVAQHGFPQWWVDYWESVAEGQGSCGTALEHGRQVIVEDVEESPIFAGTPGLDIQRRAGVRAVQSTPIITRSGKLLGMFSTHYRAPWRPDERCSRLLDLLARQSADLIERVQVETALRVSEARYRAVVEDQTEAICRFMPDGTLIFANDAYCRMFGKSAADAIGSRWQTVAHPADLPMIEAKLKELTPENPIAVIENRIYSETGGLRWMQFVNRAFFDQSGRVAELQAVARDISDRKQAETALQETHLFKQAILDAVNAQVAVLDGQGNIIEVNDAWCRFAIENAQVSGHAPLNTGIGANYLDICRIASGYNAEGAHEAAQGIQAVLDGRIQVYRQEYPCHAPNSRRWFLMTVAPLNRSKGGAVVSHHDISAPRLLAEELRQSEARIRSILRTAPVGIGVLVDRVIIEINEAFSLMTGYTPGELIGCSSRMLYLTDEDFDFVGKEKYRQIEEDGIGRVETRFCTKDGRIIDVSLSSAPIVPGDLARGVIFTAQDITAIKQAEQERLARETVQRDTLVREVHHRIKNHLQGVLGLIRNTIAAHPELADVTEIIVARVQAIAQVYGLQSSRDDARVRLCDLLQTATDSMVGAVPIEYRRPSDGIEAILTPDEAVPLALVINELLTNALKHLCPSEFQRPVIVAIDIGAEVAIARFQGGPARLPPEFDFAKRRGFQTGLGLVAALLPAKGAQLDIRQDGDDVVAELAIERPVIAEVHRLA